MALMSATDIVKAIHTDGVTGAVRIGFESLPEMEKAALTKTLIQDYPQAATDLGITWVDPDKVDADAFSGKPARVSVQLPDDFPGAAALVAAGLVTVDDVKAELAEHGSLVHIAGIGDATDAKIKEALGGE